MKTTAAATTAAAVIAETMNQKPIKKCHKISCGQVIRALSENQNPIELASSSTTVYIVCFIDDCIYVLYIIMFGNSIDMNEQ